MQCLVLSHFFDCLVNEYKEEEGIREMEAPARSEYENSVPGCRHRDLQSTQKFQYDIGQNVNLSITNPIHIQR